METKNFYSFILKSEIRGYKRTFASQFWIFWACFVYFFLISPGNTFEKRQQKQRLAFFSKLCWDENHNIKPDLIAKSQNIPLLIKKNTAKTKQLFKSDYNINEKKFLHKTPCFLDWKTVVVSLITTRLFRANDDSRVFHCYPWG